MILLTTTKILGALPERYRPFIEARNYGQISTLKRNELKEFCLSIITYSLNFEGLKSATDENILIAQTNFLMNEVLCDFKNLSKQEIEEAFKRGLKGEFGQYMGLNPKTYHLFLKSYSGLEERKAAIKAANELMEEQTPEKTAEEKELILKTAALEYFEQYKRTKIFIGYWHCVLNHVTKKHGRIIIVKGKEKQTLIESEEARVKIKFDSFNEYKEFVEKNAAAYKLQGMVSKSKQTLEILNNLDSNISYINIQKKNALKYYFDKLISEGNELEL